MLAECRNQKIITPQNAIRDVDEEEALPDRSNWGDSPGDLGPNSSRGWPPSMSGKAKYHTSNRRRGDHSESFILNALLGGFSLFVMESAWKWAADHIKDEKGDSAKENTEKPTPKTKSKAKTIATISKDSSTGSTV